MWGLEKNHGGLVVKPDVVFSLIVMIRSETTKSVVIEGLLIAKIKACDLSCSLHRPCQKNKYSGPL